MTELQHRELGNQVVDYVTVAMRAVLGMVPFAGSLLAEIAGAVIPNQRTDRLAKFAETLERKLVGLNQDFVKSQLTNESFTDLCEEGMRQAARSLTDERREYIANLIANSVSSQDIEYVESRHLLRILGELNEIEVIWLRYYREPILDDDEAFKAKHASILNPVMTSIGDSPKLFDKKTLQESYRDHLVQLGLLGPVYDIDHRTEQPKYDSFSGGLQIRRYTLTPLGWLLLKYIGLAGEPPRVTLLSE